MVEYKEITRAMDSWASKGAEWWQFWLPQSGLSGGMIFGLIITMFVWVAQ